MALMFGFQFKTEVQAENFLRKLIQMNMGVPFKEAKTFIKSKYKGY
jgi:hypothetical protein